MKAIRSLATLVLAAHLGTAPAQAADFTIGAIKISDPWSRATPAGAKVGAGYLAITNTGKEPDRLIGGTAVAAGTFEIHEMAMVDNVMRMRALPKGLEIKPGETVTLRPGGLHVMFMDLKQQLKEGQPIKGTLVFEKAGKIEIEYRVAPIGAKGPPSPGSGHGSHGKH